MPPRSRVIVGQPEPITPDDDFQRRLQEANAFVARRA